MIDQFVIPLLKIVIVLNATLVGVTYMVLLERKVIAWAQSRLGPMRVGPYGVLQPIADAIKLILKEDITPTKADRWVFTAAPKSRLSSTATLEKPEPPGCSRRNNPSRPTATAG